MSRRGMTICSSWSPLTPVWPGQLFCRRCPLCVWSSSCRGVAGCSTSTSSRRGSHLEAAPRHRSGCFLTNDKEIWVVQLSGGDRGRLCRPNWVCRNSCAGWPGTATTPSTTSANAHQLLVFTWRCGSQAPSPSTRTSMATNVRRKRQSRVPPCVSICQRDHQWGTSQLYTSVASSTRRRTALNVGELSRHCCTPTRTILFYQTLTMKLCAIAFLSSSLTKSPI